MPYALAPSHRRFAIGAAVAVVLVLSGCSAGVADQPNVRSRSAIHYAVSRVVVAIRASVAASVATLPAEVDPAPLVALCDQARAYNTAHKFQKAIDLIDSVRTPAREVLSPLPSNKPVVDAALACENERTTAVLGLATAAPKPSEPPTGIEAFGATWDAAVQSWLVPLKGSGVALLGLWASIFVLARLLVLAPRPALGKWSRLLSRVSLVCAVFAALYFPVALLLLVNGLGTPASAGAALGSIDTLLLTSIALAVAGCVYAAVTLALSLGGSNRMTVTSSDDKATSALQAGIVSRLGALGPSGARDLEVPKGTGIPSDIVSGLLPAVAGNAFVTALQAAARILLGVAPWQVEVRALDATRSFVKVTRSGRGFASATIDPERLELPADHKSAPEFSTILAIAVVLAAMSRTHTDFDGVAGATDWRSIGLHDIATTLFLGDEELAKETLGRALDYDPKNVRAEIALELLLRRKSVDAASLHSYLGWLGVKVDQLRADGWNRRGYVDLRRQVLVTYLATGRNLLAKLSAGRAAVIAPSRRVRLGAWLLAYVPLARRLDTILTAFRPAPVFASVATPALRPANYELIRKTGELYSLLRPWRHGSGGFRDRVRPIAATTIALLHREYTLPGASARLDTIERFTRSWLIEASISESPQTAYAFACFLARTNPSPGVAGKLVDRLSSRLRVAFLDPKNKEWAISDPEFRRFHYVQAFRELVLEPKPSTDFWKFAPFTPHKDLLVSLGVDRPGRFATYSNRIALREALPIARALFDQLTRLSTLVDHFETRPPSGVGDFRLEIVEALVGLGVNEPGDLTPQWFDDHSGDIGELADSLTTKYPKSPTQGELRAWLAS